jgi:hypothetical protein
MIAAVKAAIEGLRRLGPYAAIELLLPGGSLLAILLWLYRRHRLRASSAVLGACGTVAPPCT